MRTTTTTMTTPPCVGCGCAITDQYILRVDPDLEWHASCLKCADCGQMLDENCTCFVRDGKTYCKSDYTRLFGARCAKCAIAFSKSDLVMRARECIYHLDCFRCMACSRQLVPGDEFALRDDGLYCKADFEVVERGNNNNDSEIVMDNVDEQDVDSDNSSSTAVGQNSTSNNSNVSSARSSTRNERGSRKSDHKTTRVRTVLNEKQLHTLRTCYAANPRPDALMKEQLVEMTGLSPRVIRVWFQNKRCKDKKKSILMKQMHEQQQKQGVPMVASSPVRHDSVAAPIEVYQQPAPWKSLSDFASHSSDIDGNAPFQQLMTTFDDGTVNSCHPPSHLYGPVDAVVDQEGDLSH